MSFVKEFREFTMKGNLIDMSIGIVIGAAFGTVTKSFIDGIFMPLLGLVFKVGDLSQYSFQIGHTQDGKPNLVMIGSFISSVINFLIIAFVMFMLIKAMNRLKRKQEEPVPPPAGPSQEQLLTEIRDLLKNKPL
jgi:large conductance mechanosensitive channel